MCRKFVCLMTFVLLLGISGAVQADYQVTFTDDFSTPHDYLTYGVEGTVWDGFLGKGPYETANAIMATGGELFLESANGFWGGPFLGCDPCDANGVKLGPLLYKVVSGDFTAEVTISGIDGIVGDPVFSDSGGIMARVPDLDAAGDCEDFVQITVMPAWDVGNKWDNVDDGGRTEMGIRWNAWNYDKQLRLVRSGSLMFFMTKGPQPWHGWVHLIDSPYTRSDMAGLPLQVGLWQGTFSDALSWVKFDNFSLTYTVYEKARIPSPANGATNVFLDADLAWVPGDLVQDVNGHEVYFSADFNDVNDGTTPDFIVSDPYVDPGILAELTTYYWRVDEVNGPTTYRGDVWSFATASIGASNPEPPDGASVRWQTTTKLRWMPSPYAASQDLYFGTSVADANRATGPDYGGLGADVNEVNIPMALEQDMDYYWRVDTVNEPDLWKGNIWSFSTSWKTFYDDFNTPHDYLTQGVAGTGWDGFIGKGVGESVDFLEADMEPNHLGTLYVQSTDTLWDGPWDPLGPFLYKEVGGDFIATVYVADYPGLYDVNGDPDPEHEGTIMHNDVVIMARASIDPDVAGDGEDFVFIGYFPIWGGNFFRQADNNARADVCNDGMAWDCDRYIRLIREGNTFTAASSPDGTYWYPVCDPPSITRDDLEGLPLQVGLQHAVYSSSVGWVAFDDFTLQYSMEVSQPYATMPNPADGAADVAVYTSLTWNPGDLVKDVNGHEVYVGTDFNDVNDATTPDFIVSDPCVVPGPLGFSTQYFWRVDEVGEAATWKGPVWSFTTEAGKATKPIPEDGIMGVSVDTDSLGWMPGPYAVSQDVYFGISFEDVNTRTTPDIGGLAGDANSAGIPGGYLPLELTTTYYWRVDSNNGTLPATKGDVWSFTTPEIVFYDDFNTPHDYAVDGVAGTGWDGMMGLGTGETVDNLEANDVCYPGQLYIQSTYGYWQPTAEGQPYGPLLYKEVAGDFLAIVHVTDFAGDANDSVFNNVCGLMARVAKEEDAGDGPDWISVCYYATWTGHSSGNTDGGGVAFDYNTGQRWSGDPVYDIAAAEPWLRLRRVGNTFYFSISADGINWRPLPGSEEGIERTDMNDLPLQVGLWQATNNDTPTMGYAAFDDFTLYRRAWPQARGPYPADGAVDVPINTKLSWRSGDFVQDVNGHEVYFGTDFNDVNDANSTSHPNVDYYVVTDPYADPELLELSTVYFWRVDEVNGTDLWRGNIWSFTTADWVVVDDFDLYSTRDDLLTGWKDGYASWPGVTSASNIAVSGDIAEGYGTPPPGPIHEGRNAMQLVYDNDGMVTHYEPDKWPVDYWAPYYSEIDANIADLPALSDWTIQGVKALALSFFGHPDNDANEQMYVVVEDGTGAEAIAKYGDDTSEDVNNLRKPTWQQWNIDLTEFSDGGVDLNDVNKVYIGFGDRDNPAPGGYGIVYFDSIRLYRPRCVPELVPGDFTGDCIVNFEDFARLAVGWLCGPPSVAPIIDLDASALSEGLVTSWVNAGTLGGKFDINSVDVNDNPTRGTTDGLAAVIFDGNDYLIADFNAPGGITGANDFTVAMWVYNPGIGSEEWIITWARRGTDGRHAGVGYGTNGSYGAVAHWGAGPDMGFDGGIPIAGVWHHIAVTYEGGTDGTERVWVNGELNAIEDKTLDMWPDCPVTVGSNYDWDPADPNTFVDPIFHLSGSVARVQVYDYCLREHEVTYIYNGTFPADLTNDGEVNFRDLAVLVDKWLSEVLFP